MAEGNVCLLVTRALVDALAETPISSATERLTARHCIGALQKLSMHPPSAKTMIENGVVPAAARVIKLICTNQLPMHVSVLRRANALLLNLVYFKEGVTAARESDAVAAATAATGGGAGGIREDADVLGALCHMIDSEFSSFGDDLGRRSATAAMFCLLKDPVLWQSAKQRDFVPRLKSVLQRLSLITSARDFCKELNALISVLEKPSAPNVAPSSSVSVDEGEADEGFEDEFPDAVSLFVPTLRGTEEIEAKKLTHTLVRAQM